MRKSATNSPRAPGAATMDQGRPRGLPPLKTDGLPGAKIPLARKPSLRRSTSRGKSPFAQFAEQLSPLDNTDTPRDVVIPATVQHTIDDETPRVDPLRRVHVTMDSMARARKAADPPKKKVLEQKPETEFPRPSLRNPPVALKPHLQPKLEASSPDIIRAIVEEAEGTGSTSLGNLGRAAREVNNNQGWGSPVPSDLDLEDDDGESSWDGLDQPQAKGQNAAETAASKKKKQACSCAKSRCLKLYCECFAAGKICADSCECSDCANTDDPADREQRDIAVQKLIKKKGKSAFRRTSLERKQEVARTMGCNCKKSRCIRKYCECYNAGLVCGDNCKCENCANDGDVPPPPIKRKRRSRSKAAMAEYARLKRLKAEESNQNLDGNIQQRVY